MSDEEKNLATTEVYSVGSKGTKSHRTIHLTKDVDEAMKYAVSNKEDEVLIDPATNRKLLFKIDCYLLPLFCILYATQFMDKISISSASVLGLRTDLAMEGDMYSWAGTAFYIGYLIFVFPASALLQRLPLGLATAGFILAWGVTLACHAACSNYAGFMVCRVILGMLESAITPAMMIFTSQWYKKEEQFLRTAIWFACNGMGTIIANAIGYGIATRVDSISMEPWKIIFIIMGCWTVLLSAAFFFHIPDNPSKAWFLTPEEKKLVVERIRTNEQGFGNKTFKMYQFKEALGDIITWIYFLNGAASCIPNGALTNFSSILLNDDFGYTTTQTMLMGMPAGAVEVVGCILFAWSARFLKYRLVACIAATITTLLGVCLLAFAPQKNGRLAGYYMQSVGAVAMICVLSLFASNTAGHTKKITMNAIFLVGYSAGNIAGPQTFIASQAPSYTGGKIAFVVCFSASVFLISSSLFVYWNRNRKRAKLIAEQGMPEEIENHEFADLTDKENPYFVYSL